MSFYILFFVQTLVAGITTAKSVGSSFLRTEGHDKVINGKLVSEFKRDDVFDCTRGCLMSIGDPVCGHDGISYQNKCLASCQNVAVKSYRECPGDEKMNGKTYDTESEVSKSDIVRFKNDDFVFVAKRKFVDFVKNTDEHEVLLKENQHKTIDSQIDNDRENEYGSLMLVRRITNNGSEYVKKVDAKHMEDLVENRISSYPPIIKNQRARYLNRISNEEDRNEEDQRGIVGKDTRSQVCLESCFPYSAIGEFDSLKKEGGCTGTVISPNSVITAAHCLYENGQYTSLQLFAPGRFRNTQGEVTNPYKVWKIDSVTLFSNWITTGKVQYDIALAHFTENEGQNIGEVTGYMGIAATTNDSNNLQSATVTGYPRDKEDGEMWTSGECEGGFEEGFDDVITYHQCDSKKGTDGAALLDLSKNIVYGVNVDLEPGNDSEDDPDVPPKKNVGVIIHESNIGLIMSVAGGIAPGTFVSKGP